VLLSWWIGSSIILKLSRQLLIRSSKSNSSIFAYLSFNTTFHGFEAVIDIIRRTAHLDKPSLLSDCFPQYEYSASAFEKPPASSNFCKLLVNVYCCNLDDCDNKGREMGKTVPPRFCVALAQRRSHIRKLMLKGDIGLKYQPKLAEYHEHNSGIDNVDYYCNMRRGDEEDVQRCTKQARIE
jgi:hypothetical protein